MDQYSHLMEWKLRLDCECLAQGCRAGKQVVVLGCEFSSSDSSIPSPYTTLLS